MKRKIAVSALFVVLLVLCAAARMALSPRPVDLESMDSKAAWTYLAEDIDIGDGGVLSGRPCRSPCVFGVRIGETRLDQVIPVLEQNGITRCWTEPSVSWSLVSCGGNRLNVQVDNHTRLVNAIWFHPSLPIRLGDLIEVYGAPGYVTMDQDAPGSVHPRFYWNSIRMVVPLPEISGEDYDVGQTTLVEEVSFSDESVYRTSDKVYNSYYQPWNGFGLYRPLVPLRPWTGTAIPTATP